ncbi:flavodoxin reductase [Flavihumibacter sp. R14]|nr:flavodoxin reductase [Flavihumibacter soli]
MNKSDRGLEQTAEDLQPTNGHIVKVLKTEMLTHNVKHFTVEKPAGYTFVSGQATDVSINTASLRNELRPFTFTSINSSAFLEFIIKIYKGHQGITELLEQINPGDELVLHEVFGTITYKGPGLFIAGGAGITPFISILRQLRSERKLAGNSLLFGNRTVADLFLHQELKGMLGYNYWDILEKSDDSSIPGRLIDRKLLSEHVNRGNEFYYVCGPETFTAIMVDHLKNLGIAKSRIIIEE